MGIAVGRFGVPGAARRAAIVDGRHGPARQAVGRRLRFDGPARRRANAGIANHQPLPFAVSHKDFVAVLAEFDNRPVEATGMLDPLGAGGAGQEYDGKRKRQD